MPPRSFSCLRSCWNWCIYARLFCRADAFDYTFKTVVYHYNIAGHRVTAILGCCHGTSRQLCSVLVRQAVLSQTSSAKGHGRLLLPKDRNVHVGQSAINLDLPC
uniref:Uncharacterized protein n=1 Tax=Ixodes ricinus TaxID=34613 RepID=A0A6B0U844_IXORI